MDAVMNIDNQNIEICEEIKNFAEEQQEKFDGTTKKMCGRIEKINESLDKIMNDLEFSEDYKSNSKIILQKSELNSDSENEEKRLFEHGNEKISDNENDNENDHDKARIFETNSEISHKNSDQPIQIFSSLKNTMQIPKIPSPIDNSPTSIRNSINQKAPIISPIKAQSENSSEKIQQQISFGEICYFHIKRERMKKWLLLGEKGVIRISDSQDFNKVEQYRLQNVIKMGYADVFF